MPEPFRTAAAPTPAAVPAPSAPVEPAAEPSKAGDEPTGTPIANRESKASLLATYEESQGKPFIAEYMGLGEMWNKQPSLKYESQVIESFLRDQVVAGTISNSTDAARKYLADIENRAGVNEYESPIKRMTKIQAYIKFRKVVDN